MSRRPRRVAASRMPRPRARRVGPLGRIGVALAAVAAVGMLIALSTQWARTYTLARQAGGLEQHRRELVAQNQRLREEIGRLETDDRYIEQLARQQLGLVRPGEIELLIVPPASPRAAGPATGDSHAGERTAGGPQAARVHEPATGGPDVFRAVREILRRLFGWPQ